MTNLPPGVTVSMIPGNRPIDEAWDAFWDQADFYSLLDEWLAKEHDDVMKNGSIREKALWNLIVDLLNKYVDDDNASDLGRELVEGSEQFLPVERWFEDWMESNRGGE